MSLNVDVGRDDESVVDPVDLAVLRNVTVCIHSVCVNYVYACYTYILPSL